MAGYLLSGQRGRRPANAPRGPWPCPPLEWARAHSVKHTVGRRFDERRGDTFGPLRTWASSHLGLFTPGGWG